MATETTLGRRGWALRRRGRTAPGPCSCARRRLQTAHSPGFPCHLWAPRGCSGGVETRGDARLTPASGIPRYPREAGGSAARLLPAPQPRSGLRKTLVGWLAGGANDTATQDRDSRAALAPPRPVISLPLPAGVNNSPGCQMQVTFVAAMKEPGRRRLIFWGAGGGVGNQLKLNKGSGGGGENGGNKAGNFF